MYWFLCRKTRAERLYASRGFSIQFLLLFKRRNSYSSKLYLNYSIHNRVSSLRWKVVIQLLLLFKEKHFMNIVWKIVIAIVAILVISKFLSPLLLPLLAPFGLIILIVLYGAVVAWLLGWTPLP